MACTHRPQSSHSLCTPLRVAVTAVYGMSCSYVFLYRSGMSRSDVFLYRSGMSRCDVFLYRSGMSRCDVFLYRSRMSCCDVFLYRSGMSRCDVFLYRSRMSCCDVFLYRSGMSRCDVFCFYSATEAPGEICHQFPTSVYTLTMYVCTCIGPNQLSCLGSSVVEHSVLSVECRGFESHLRQLIFLRKSDCLGCAACLVCLTLLASFIKTCIYVCMLTR